jgi:hypothetical protein
VARLFRFLPVIAVVSAILTTVVFGAAFWARLDALSKDTSRLLANFGSFRGMPVATQEEVESAYRVAEFLRSAWHWLAALFVASTVTALWQGRGQASDWPWLSALAFGVGLGVLAFGVAFTVGVWGLPIALGVAAAALSGFEVVRYRRSGRPVSIVTWAALSVSLAALVVNLVRPRGY